MAGIRPRASKRSVSMSKTGMADRSLFRRMIRAYLWDVSEGCKRRPMSGDGDMIKLYSQRILALAADIPFTERLDAPQVTARKRSPLCDRR